MDVAAQLSRFNLFLWQVVVYHHHPVGGTIHALFNAFFSGVRFVMLIFRQKARFNFIICLHFAFCNNPASALASSCTWFICLVFQAIFFWKQPVHDQLGGRRQLMLIHTLMKDKLHRLHLLCYARTLNAAFTFNSFLWKRTTQHHRVLTENVITTF